MSLQMVSARSENQGIALHCPHCSFMCRHDVSHLEDCIKFREPLVCVACGKEFRVVVHKARSASSNNEMKRSGQGRGESPKALRTKD